MVYRLFSGRRVVLLGVLAYVAAVGMLVVGSSTLSAATAPHPRVAMSVAQRGQVAAATAPKQVNYLWSIPGASGSLTGPNDQHLVLRLVGVRNYLTRFTDRPVRQAFVVANADFVRRFKAYFRDANPNAVLSFRKAGSRIPTEIVLHIGQPRWNPKTSTLTFPAVRSPKREDNLPDTSVHIKPPLIPNPRHFDQASLFIDSGSTSPGCSQSGSTATCTYLFTGSRQLFTVPAGVTSLQVVAVGGQGGSGLGGPGGYGAKVAGTLAVTPGNVLYVYVGGNGGNASGADANGQPGGFPDGGAGGNGSPGGGGGGGVSDIEIPFQPIVVAAGGGGAPGAESGGGDAGLDGGGNPTLLATSGGGAGTSTAGGSGGSQTSNVPAYLCSPPSNICGSAGSQFNGGHGGDANGVNVPGGGGGGAGWYGGGGGAIGSGGGGGSSLLPPGFSLASNHTYPIALPPEVQLSWQVPTG
jgi:hypothetical protein